MIGTLEYRTSGANRAATFRRNQSAHTIGEILGGSGEGIALPARLYLYEE